MIYLLSGKCHQKTSEAQVITQGKEQDIFYQQKSIEVPSIWAFNSVALSIDNFLSCPRTVHIILALKNLHFNECLFGILHRNEIRNL